MIKNNLTNAELERRKAQRFSETLATYASTSSADSHNLQPIDLMRMQSWMGSTQQHLIDSYRYVPRPQRSIADWEHRYVPNLNLKQGWTAGWMQGGSSADDNR